MDSSLCHWNLDSGFQLLVRFRIPWAVFQIPKPRIPDSTCKVFLDSWFHGKNFPDSLTWGDIYSILKPIKLFLCYFLFVVEHVTDHNRTILWRERIERKKRRNKGKENYAFIYYSTTRIFLTYKLYAYFIFFTGVNKTTCFTCTEYELSGLSCDKNFTVVPCSTQCSIFRGQIKFDAYDQVIVPIETRGCFDCTGNRLFFILSLRCLVKKSGNQADRSYQ